MTIRILTHINYSCNGNPEGDSGLYFTSQLIKSIVYKNKSFHFYVLIPLAHKEVWLKELEHPQITTLPIEISSRTHGGDFHFNPNQLLNVLKLRNYEFDCLFINQPELTNAYLHFFNKLLFHNISAFSYVHWFDVRGVNSKKKIHEPALMSAISGMLSSKVVGCNSKYGKNHIIEYSKKWLNSDCVELLGEKIQILPPGIDTNELDIYRFSHSSKKNKTIIVNHRLLKYTGVRDLLSQIFPKLWELRRDFKVVVTNPSRVRLPKKITNVPWLKIGNFSRSEYIKQLWASDIVIAPHKSTHWSISTLEALYTNNVPLLNNDSFFPELMNPILSRLNKHSQDYIISTFFYSNKSLVDKLCFLLDNIENEKKFISILSNLVKDEYDWDNLTDKWIKIFKNLDTENHMISETNPSLIKILDMVKDNRGGISKRDILKNLVWGPQSSTLSWTAFRSRLKNITYDNSTNSEVVYQIAEIDETP